MQSNLTYTNKEIALLTDYRYTVERYIASLQQLTVIARPFIESSRKSVFITFMGVKYMQLLPYWESASFHVATENECLTFLNNVGLEIMGEIPHLYYAQLPKTKVNIICGLIRVSDSMPT